MIEKSGRLYAMVSYLVILSVTLSLFSLLIYGNFKISIYEDLDDFLTERAHDVADSLNMYIRFKPELLSGKTNSFALVGSEDFINNSREWLREKGRELAVMGVAVQILDHKGKIIATSNRAPKLMPLNEDDMQDILKGEESVDIVKGEAPNGKKEKFRLYSLPVKFREQVICVVQTTSRINLLELALHNLGLVLCVFLPLTVLLAGIPGVFLIKITLNPVDKMINTIQKITSGNLKLRIHIPETKDAIKRLATTFNQMLDRLERSLTCQNAFVGTIVNGINEPLDALKQDISTVLAQKSVDEENRKTLSSGLREIKSLSQSLESLVILTDIEEGKTPLEIRKTDVSGVANETVKNFQPKTVTKDIELASYVDPGVVIDCDRSQIRELLQILLDNALKYTNRNGKIVVTVKQLDTNIQISVIDTGIGMPEEEIPYIFDRFYQISSGKRQRSGFGIGLSVAKVIVQEHHGTIGVSSQLGQGSTFTVHLPKNYQI